MLHAQGVPHNHNQHECADEKDKSEASSERSQKQKDGAAEDEIKPPTENE